MAYFEDILDEPVKPQEGSCFDKEAWAKKRGEQRKETYALAEKTMQSVCSDAVTYMGYLRVQSRFLRISVTNALLLFAQMPNVTQIRDHDEWRAAGCFIRKGERGISILEPGREYQKPDGTVGVSYHVKKVFDICQTTALGQPEAAPQSGARTLLRALLQASIVPIQRMDDTPAEAGAYYDEARRVITVCPGMNASRIFRCVSGEIIRTVLASAYGSGYVRENTDIAAYSAAYMLCHKYGVDSSDFCFDNMSSLFPQTDTKALRMELTAIRDLTYDLDAKLSRLLEQERRQGRQRGTER